MQRIVVRYGLIAGALMALMFLVTMQFHDRIGFGTAALVVGYTTMVLAFLLVYFGVRSYRDEVAGGTIGFFRALGVGLLISLVATLVYVVAWELLYFNVYPDYMERYAAYTLEQARLAGATAEELAAQATEMRRFQEMYRNPLIVAAFTFLEPLPVALVMSLVSAAMLCRGGRARDRDVPAAARTAS